MAYSDDLLNDIKSGNTQRSADRNWVAAETDLANYLMDVPAKMAYPTDAFPPRTRSMIEGYNRVYGAAPDHYGLSIITAVATALGNSIAVKVKKELHPMIFFSIIVARPGSGKTPTINTVLRPIKKRASRKIREHINSVEELKAEHEQRGKGADELILPQPEQVVLVSYSLEALYTALQFTPRGCIIHRDEAIAWLKAQDQYKSGGGDEAEFYLSAHNAEGYTISRKNLPVPIVIDAIQLNFLGGTQPGVLSAFAGGNNQQNGGLARILFSYPDQTEYRPLNEDEPAADYAHRWAQIIENLYDVQPNAVEDDFAEGLVRYEPYELELSPEAFELYRTYYDSLQVRISKEENDVAVDTLVKFRTHSLRIAGALHALEWSEKLTNFTDDDEYEIHTARNSIFHAISKETMDRALRITQYHEFTSLKVINAISSPAERLPHGRRAWYLALPDEGGRKDAIALAKSLNIKGLSGRTAERLLKDKTLFDYRAGNYRKLY